jgi:hypothetical protein
MASEEYIQAAGNQGKWCLVIEHTIDSAEVFVQTIMPEAENDEQLVPICHATLRGALFETKPCVEDHRIH